MTPVQQVAYKALTAPVRAHERLIDVRIACIIEGAVALAQREPDRRTRKAILRAVRTLRRTAGLPRPSKEAHQPSLIATEAACVRRRANAMALEPREPGAA
jgi:hypothetical protein